MILSGLGWILFSVLAAVGSAGMYLVNQYARIPGVYLVITSRVLVILATLAPALYFGMPADPLFYLGVCITAVVGVAGDVRVFNVSARYGGGVTSRVMPLQVFGGFILWLAIHPEQITDYLASPARSLGVLTSLGVCVWFSTRLHKCTISKAAFAELLPAIFFYAITITFNKFAIDHASVNSGVFNYMFVQCLIAVPMFGLYSHCNRREHIKTSRLLTARVFKAGAVLFLCWTGHMIFKLYAMAWTDNPAYVAAIILTAPLFIQGYYRLTGHAEKADIGAGLGIVASAMLLAAFSLPKH